MAAFRKEWTGGEFLSRDYIPAQTVPADARGRASWEGRSVSSPGTRTRGDLQGWERAPDLWDAASGCRAGGSRVGPSSTGREGLQGLG